MSFYSFKSLTESLTDYELFYTLKAVLDEDCFIHEFLDNNILESFICLLEAYDIVWITSDGRVLLTEKGENMFFELSLAVELIKKTSKINKNKKLCKTKKQP